MLKSVRCGHSTRGRNRVASIINAASVMTITGGVWANVWSFRNVSLLNVQNAGVQSQTTHTSVHVRSIRLVIKNIIITS